MFRLFIIHIFLIVFAVSYCACDNRSEYKDRFTLKPAEKPIEIPIGSQTKNFVFSYQYIIIDGDNYLGILNYDHNRVEIYNFDTGKFVKLFQFYHEGSEAFGQVSNFFIENLDSLLVDCESQLKIGIADSNGSILRKLSYKTDINGRRFIFTPPWVGSRPYKTGSKIYYLQSYMLEDANGLLTEEKREETFLNVVLNTETGESITLPLVYPEEMIGKDVWKSPNVMRTISGDSLLVYHFWNLPELFVSDGSCPFRKVPVESNYKLKLNQDSYNYRFDMVGSLVNTLSHDMIRDILYDKYRDCYYLFYMKRNENPDPKSDVLLKMQYPDCFILILDKNFKHMGEVFLSDNTYSFQFSFITPEGLYISEDHPNNPDFDEDYMRFRLFKLGKL